MKRLLCSLLFIFLIKSMSGAVVLPSVLSDHMVLQQFSWVYLWGRADPGESFTIVTGWNDKSAAVRADPSGNWAVRMFSGGPGGPYTITITATNKVVIHDVMVGEVWICSGQSNMEYTFKDLGGWPYFPELKKRVDTSHLQKIRLCTVKKQVSKLPSDTCHAEWLQADSSTILNFSATALYFGLELYKQFHVPIGLIVSAWGGTPAEAWTPLEYLKYSPGLSYYVNHPNNPSWDASAPSVLFNGMINPLRNYTIKGFIWYQGEANRYDADLYGNLMSGMIRSWRQYFRQPELPFFFVQIAPYDYHDYKEASGFLREAQEKALTVENTGMAVTLDIGNLKDIHPKNKEEVGRRLSMLAIAKAYKQTCLRSWSGPAYWFSRIETDKIQVYFKNSDFVYGKSDNITGFRIAGSDGVFKPATAVIMGSSVMVSSTEVPEPKYVRYAFLNTDTASIFDRWGLPAGSFRTDTLHVNYREVVISPVFDPAGKSWKVGLHCADNTAVIHYTTDGSTPSDSSAICSDSLRFTSGCHLIAKAFLQGAPSQSSAEIEFIKHEALGCKAALKAQPNPRYGGNEFTLTDGMRGSENYYDGRWLGFLSNDLQAVIDLGEEKQIGEVKISFLVNTASYIFPPVSVEFYTSANGSNYEKAGTFKPAAPGKGSLEAGASILHITSDRINRQARYIKVIGVNQKTNPPWHNAPGQKCWLFVDEVECLK